MTKSEAHEQLRRAPIARSVSEVMHWIIDALPDAEPQAEPTDMPDEIWAGPNLIDAHRRNGPWWWKPVKGAMQYISYDEHERLMNRRVYGVIQNCPTCEKIRQERDVMISAARAEEQEIAAEERERCIRDAEQRGYNEGRGYPGGCSTCEKVREWAKSVRQDENYSEGARWAAKEVLSMMSGEEATDE